MQMGPEDWLALAQLIQRTADADPGLDGFVVTHGTASTEETAYFLNLVLSVRQSVVVVGAQRPSNGLGTDAGINLVNAIRVATCPETRDMGVVVVLNDEIQAAREVTKTSTLRMHTFRSPDFGVLGHADADAITYYRTPRRMRAPNTELALNPDEIKELPRVDIAYAYAGTDGTAVQAFTNAGALGIISAGFAPGGTTTAEVEALEAAIAAGVCVVQTSRAGSGRVTQRRNLPTKGIIAGDNLNPQKARVLLMAALTKTRDREAIGRIFQTH